MTTISQTKPADGPSSVAENLPDAKNQAISTVPARPASPCADRLRHDSQSMLVGATPRDRQGSDEAQSTNAVAQLNGSQGECESHIRTAAVELLFCAAFLSDTERLRIATENRLRALTEHGLDADIYGRQLDALLALEHQATLALQRAVRKHPLGPWIKRTTGVGEKQGARLIAAIGEVAWNHLEGRPRRGPAELWAYCGFRPDQRRRKGAQSSWNAEAKMRAYLCAEAALKSGVRQLPGCDDSQGYDFEHRKAVTPLGARYLSARANWADHGTTDAHKHNHALRCVAKAMLKDLFLEARRVGA